jgi:hypothetical protein
VPIARASGCAEVAPEIAVGEHQGVAAQRAGNLGGVVAEERADPGQSQPVLGIPVSAFHPGLEPPLERDEYHG